MRTPYSDIDTDEDLRYEHHLQRLPLEMASLRIVAVTTDGKQIVLTAPDLEVEGKNGIAILRSTRHSAIPLHPLDRLPEPDHWRLIIDCGLKPSAEGSALTVSLVDPSADPAPQGEQEEGNEPDLPLDEKIQNGG